MNLSSPVDLRVTIWKSVSWFTSSEWYFNLRTQGLSRSKSREVGPSSSTTFIESKRRQNHTVNNFWARFLTWSCKGDIPVIAFFGVEVAARCLVLGSAIASFTDVGELLGDVRGDACVEWNVDLVAVVMRIGTSSVTYLLEKKKSRVSELNDDGGVVLSLRCLQWRWADSPTMFSVFSSSEWHCSSLDPAMYTFADYDCCNHLTMRWQCQRIWFAKGPLNASVCKQELDRRIIQCVRRKAASVVTRNLCCKQRWSIQRTRATIDSFFQLVNFQAFGLTNCLFSFVFEALHLRALPDGSLVHQIDRRQRYCRIIFPLVMSWITDAKISSFREIDHVYFE